jgi:hypothetical protein
MMKPAWLAHRGDVQLLKHFEHFEDGVDIGLAEIMPEPGAPGRVGVRGLADQADMVALGHSPSAARIGGGERNAERSDGLNEGAHRGAAALVDETVPARSKITA